MVDGGGKMTRVVDGGVAEFEWSMVDGGVVEFEWWMVEW